MIFCAEEYWEYKMKMTGRIIFKNIKQNYWGDELRINRIFFAGFKKFPTFTDQKHPDGQE